MCVICATVDLSAMVKAAVNLGSGRGFPGRIMGLRAWQYPFQAEPWSPRSRKQLGDHLA